MIAGIGIDVVSIARIREAMKDPRFLERILTVRERELEMTAERVAGRWAAKEALSKAIPGLRRWHDVEVMNGPSGEPLVTLSPSVALPSGVRLHVSISHESGYAAAVAVVEGARP